MILAPIIVTVYDRLQHFQQCIEALQRNRLSRDSNLYVVSDAPGKAGHEPRIDQVRAYARSITGFRKVHLVFRENNYGAHRSFLAITQQVLDEHDRFIHLEDDVLASPNFLDYMNDGLDFYEADQRIFSIGAYTLPIQLPADFKADVFFLPSHCSWGFATWKARWKKVDLSDQDRYAVALADRALYHKIVSTGSHLMHILWADSKGRIQTPDIRVAFHQFMHDVYTVHPRVSKVMNIGFDGTGMHCSTDPTHKYTVQSDRSTDKISFVEAVRLDPAIIRRIRNYHNGSLRQRLGSSLVLAKHRWLAESRTQHAC
jgi:hypothetical protein